MSASPKSSRRWTPSGTETFQETYKVSYSHLLGEGGFGHVYKGLDIVENRNVAVKIYKSTAEAKDAANVQQEFAQCVESMLNLADSFPDLDCVLVGVEEDNVSMPRLTSFDPRLIADDVTKFYGTRDKAKMIMSSMDLKSCFVQLLGCSRDAFGRPGLDVGSEKYFVVTELGSESLEESLVRHADRGTTLNVEELRLLQWSLVSIVCGLHAAGFVHLDIKPCNVMQFGETWKLIDFDGAVRTQSVVEQEKFCVTPWYLAPEVARMLGKSRQFTVSRLMDVWSVGMCALEAVFLQPVLLPWYDEWQAATGSDAKFFAWLGDYDTPIMEGEMRDAMSAIDVNMAEFLQGMLTKDPSRRSCIAECLVHPWFDEIRSRLWMDVAISERSGLTGSERSGLIATPGAQVMSSAPGLQKGDGKAQQTKNEKSRMCVVM